MMRKLSSALAALLGLLITCPVSAARREEGKAGAFMVNLKLGPTIPIYMRGVSGSVLDVLPAAFALQLEGGVALDRERRAYLLLPFQLHVGSKSFFGLNTTHTKVIVPLGFQYDIPIHAVPGLYVYPRVSLGYVAYVISGNISGTGLGGSGTYHGGMFSVEAGVKYVIRRRFNIGLEPFSLPVHFFANGDRTEVMLDYRIHAYGGVNF